MEKWKVDCILFQDNKIIAYDMISSTGTKRTVSMQELYNAITNGVVVNALYENNKIVVQEPVQKRVLEKEVNIHLKVSEFYLLYPYIEKLYSRLIKNGEKNEKILQVLQHFTQIKVFIDQVGDNHEKGKL